MMKKINLPYKSLLTIFYFLPRGLNGQTQKTIRKALKVNLRIKEIIELKNQALKIKLAEINEKQGVFKTDPKNKELEKEILDAQKVFAEEREAFPDEVHEIEAMEEDLLALKECLESVDLGKLEQQLEGGDLVNFELTLQALENSLK